MDKDRPGTLRHRQAIPAGNSWVEVCSCPDNRIGNSCAPVGVIPRRGFSFARKQGKPDLDRIPGYIRAFKPNSVSRKVDRFADQLFAEMFESRQGSVHKPQDQGEVDMTMVKHDARSERVVVQALQFLLDWMPAERLQSAFGRGVIVVTNTHARPAWVPKHRLVQTDGTVGATLHEFGHVIEEGLGLAKFSLDWLIARSKGVFRLSMVDPEYRRDEVAYDGNFYDPYVGKYYADGMGTEVLSMGMELLYTEEQEFMKADFNHYALVVGVLSGRLP